MLQESGKPREGEEPMGLTKAGFRSMMLREQS